MSYECDEEDSMRLAKLEKVKDTLHKSYEIENNATEYDHLNHLNDSGKLAVASWYEIAWPAPASFPKSFK